MACPDNYMQNCMYYEVYCHQCAALGNGNKLKYKTLNSTFPYKSHPYNIEIKNLIKESLIEAEKERQSRTEHKRGKINNRVGRSNEKKVLGAIEARGTIASGSVLGDGDGYLTIGGEKFGVEVKTRIANRNVTGPTIAEIEKGKGQGVRLWVISSETCGELVTMSKETLMEILEYLNG